MFLVDSDWLIDYIDGLPEAVLVLESLVGDGIAFSVISYLEAFEGTLRANDVALAQNSLDAGIEAFRVYAVTEEIARTCAAIRHDLRSRGRRVRERAFDLLIAATAMEHDLTLVTRNLDDFGDVVGLRLYPRRAR